MVLWFNAKKAVELGFADEIMFDGNKTEDVPAEPDEAEDDNTPGEEKGDENGGIHLEAPEMAEAMEGLLYSTRRMGQAILNSIVDALSDEDEAPVDEVAVDEAASDGGEAPPSEDQSEGQTAPVAEDPAEEEAPVDEEPAPVVTLPQGFIAVGSDGRTEDGSVPFIILKNQLERMR